MRLSERRPHALVISLVAITILGLAFFLTPKQHLPNLPQLPHLSSFYGGSGGGKITAATQPGVWLVATISAASSQRRRNIIRATMKTPYANPSICFRFVISNPTDRWMPLIQHENDTYGDIILLSHLEESAHIANTVKTLEFLKFATSTSFSTSSSKNSGRPWKFVSKVDDDSFVALPTFYREYLAPLLIEDSDDDDDNDDTRTETSFSETSLNPHVLIGRKLQGHRPFPYPGGQFYTLSRKTARVLVKQYQAHPITDEDEDVLVGRLLYEAGEEFQVTELPNPVAFDYDSSVGDEWAWSHNISGVDNINPHRLKEDEAYLDVARQMVALHPAGGG